MQDPDQNGVGTLRNSRTWQGVPHGQCRMRQEKCQHAIQNGKSRIFNWAAKLRAKLKFRNLKPNRYHHPKSSWSNSNFPASLLKSRFSERPNHGALTTTGSQPTVNRVLSLYFQVSSRFSVPTFLARRLGLTNWTPRSLNRNQRGLFRSAQKAMPWERQNLSTS
jgi:hypothetical protein